MKIVGWAYNTSWICPVLNKILVIIVPTDVLAYVRKHIAEHKAIFTFVDSFSFDYQLFRIAPLNNVVKMVEETYRNSGAFQKLIYLSDLPNI